MTVDPQNILAFDKQDRRAWIPMEPAIFRRVGMRGKAASQAPMHVFQEKRNRRTVFKIKPNSLFEMVICMSVRVAPRERDIAVGDAYRDGEGEKNADILYPAGNVALNWKVNK
jgi:hypothetical protein